MGGGGGGREDLASLDQRRWSHQRAHALQAVTPVVIGEGGGGVIRQRYGWRKGSDVNMRAEASSCANMAAVKGNNGDKGGMPRPRQGTPTERPCTVQHAPDVIESP